MATGSIESQVANAVVKEALKRIDIQNLADQIAPKLQALIVKELAYLAENKWSYDDLMYEVIDNNKELKKVLAARVAKAFTK